MSEKWRRPPIHRIKRQSLPETLADSLRERILNGEFKEGDPLVQEAIAEEYEVSRMPVREALRLLEASGLIAMKTHKGAIVTSIPTEEIGELFELRALLECEILGRAIPRMTDDHLVNSQSILAQLEDAYHRRDVHSWGGLNWEFHRSLYIAAQRTQTLSVIQGINVQTDRYIRLLLILTTGGLADAEQEHREILRLCMARDAGQAVPYLRKHIQDAGRNLIIAIKQSRSAEAA
jgi:DNA-binding GntR family transcriptional regulator